MSLKIPKNQSDEEDCDWIPSVLLSGDDPETSTKNSNLKNDSSNAAEPRDGDPEEDNDNKNNIKNELSDSNVLGRIWSERDVFGDKSKISDVSGSKILGAVVWSSEEDIEAAGVDIKYRKNDGTDEDSELFDPEDGPNNELFAYLEEKEASVKDSVSLKLAFDPNEYEDGLGPDDNFGIPLKLYEKTSADKRNLLDISNTEQLQAVKDAETIVARSNSDAPVSKPVKSNATKTLSGRKKPLNKTVVMSEDKKKNMRNTSEQSGFLMKGPMIPEFKGPMDEAISFKIEDETITLEFEGVGVPTGVSSKTGRFRIVAPDVASTMILTGNEVPISENEISSTMAIAEIYGDMEMVGNEYMATEGMVLPDKETTDPTNVYSRFIVHCKDGNVPFKVEDVNMALQTGVIGKNDALFLNRLIEKQHLDIKSGEKLKAAHYVYHYFDHLKNGKSLRGVNGVFFYTYMVDFLKLKNHPFGLRVSDCNLRTINLSGAVINDLSLNNIRVSDGINLSNAKISENYYSKDLRVMNGDVNEKGIRVGQGLFVENLKVLNGSLILTNGKVGTKKSPERSRNFGIVKQSGLNISHDLREDNFTCKYREQVGFRVGRNYSDTNLDAIESVMKDIRVGGNYSPYPQNVKKVVRIKVNDSVIDWSTQKSTSSIPPDITRNSEPNDEIEAIEIGVPSGNPSDFLVSHKEAVMHGVAPAEKARIRKKVKETISSVPPPIPKSNRPTSSVPPPIPKSNRPTSSVPPPIPNEALLDARSNTVKSIEDFFKNEK